MEAPRQRGPGSVEQEMGNEKLEQMQVWDVVVYVANSCMTRLTCQGVLLRLNRNYHSRANWMFAGRPSFFWDPDHVFDTVLRVMPLTI